MENKTFTYTLSSAGRCLVDSGKGCLPTEYHDMFDQLADLYRSGAVKLDESDGRFDGLDTRGFVIVT